MRGADARLAALAPNLRRASSTTRPATPSARWTSCAKRTTRSCSACWRRTWPATCRSSSLADHLSALADTHRRRHRRRRLAARSPRRHREVPRFAVIAYGKLGGKELGYVSDLDVIFLFDDDDQEAPATVRQAGAALHHLDDGAHLGRHPVRHRHRPAPGRRQRACWSRRVAAFERYQNSAAWVWEHQALTRARFCAGDAAIGARFEAIREQVLRKDRADQADALKGEVRADARAHARRATRTAARCSTSSTTRAA